MASRRRHRRRRTPELDEDDLESFQGEDDGALTFDDELEIAEKKPPKPTMSRSVRPPTFYHKKVVLRDYNGSDAATLKMLEQDCLQTIRTHVLGSAKLTDKLIEYEDKVKKIAEETNQSVVALLKRAGILSPERMHELVVDKACGKFGADYEKLGASDKREIFGQIYEPGHRRRKK